MNSIWTDLLFLHGHLVRKEDLAWSDQKCSGQEREETAAGVSPGAAVAPAPKRRKFRWPRLAAPR